MNAKKSGNETKVNVNIFNPEREGAEQKEIHFDEALTAIVEKHAQDSKRIELQVDAIQRLNKQLRELEAGLRVTWHNNRPDTVGIDATAISEYAKKYLRG